MSCAYLSWGYVMAMCRCTCHWVLVRPSSHVAVMTYQNLMCHHGNPPWHILMTCDMSWRYVMVDFLFPMLWHNTPIRPKQPMCDHLRPPWARAYGYDRARGCLRFCVFVACTVYACAWACWWVCVCVLCLLMCLWLLCVLKYVYAHVFRVCVCVCMCVFLPKYVYFDNMHVLINHALIIFTYLLININYLGPIRLV